MTRAALQVRSERGTARRRLVGLSALAAIAIISLGLVARATPPEATEEIGTYFGTSSSSTDVKRSMTLLRDPSVKAASGSSQPLDGGKQAAHLHIGDLPTSPVPEKSDTWRSAAAAAPSNVPSPQRPNDSSGSSPGKKLEKAAPSPGTDQVLPKSRPHSAPLTIQQRLLKWSRPTAADGGAADSGRAEVRLTGLQDQPAEVELAAPPSELPEGAPFEIIEQSGTLTVQLARSKLLRTKFNVYRTAIVNPRICDVVQFTPREISIIGKSAGSTHVTFWFEDGEHEPMTYLVRVSPDTSAREDLKQEYRLLEDILARHFPDSKVRLFPVADKLIVKGQAKDSEEAAQILAIIRAHTSPSPGAGRGNIQSGTAARVLTRNEAGDLVQAGPQVINLLRVPGVQQVALRVKIAELNRTAARGFGIDIDARIELNGDDELLIIRSLLNAAAGNAPALLGEFDDSNIKVGLRYLQQHGVVRMLSEPTLVTLSGQPATFIAGGEFAVPTVVGTGGLNAVTTDFRAFGAIISFLPTVVDKDRIRLQVAPEFSQINDDLSVGGTPGLNVRAVTTTVEMREGQTLAIAGLLDDTMVGNRKGDLPLVHKIFGTRDITRNETELIILVTPELVHPMEPEEVPPLPGFDVTEPTNRQFFWHGRLEGNPTWEHRSTVWPRLKKRYGAGGSSMISGPFGHGQ